MSEYIINTYQRGSTQLSYEKINPTCVKQWDPLSLIIFNMIMDRMVTKILPKIGAEVG